MNPEQQLSTVILNGKPCPAEEAVMHLTSRLARYGEGCFDTFRVFQRGVLLPDRHLERLHSGMEYLDLEIPEALADTESFLKLLSLFLDFNKAGDTDVRIRISVWADDDSVGYRPGFSRPAQVLIQGAPLPEQQDPGRSDTVKLITSRYRRIPSESLPSGVKWSNGINYILAAGEARRHGVDDALMLTRDGYVSETTIANLFWKKNKEIFTPSDECDLLPGITRKFVMELLEEAGMPVQVGKFQPEDLDRVEMVWACNSVKELYPVTEIDGRSCPVDEQFLDLLCNEYQQKKMKKLQYVR